MSLAQNGVTIVASEETVGGNSYELNGVTYRVVVDRDDLLTAVDNNEDLSLVVTSKVTDMSYIFQGTSFNGDISSWDTSNVTI